MKMPGVLFALIIIITSCTTAPATPAASTAVSIPLSSSTPTATPISLPTMTPVPAGAVELHPFGTVNIETVEIEFDVNGDGQDVDSISFWEAPDAAQSLMFVSSKGNSSIEVYRYPFETQLQTIACGEASNGVWVDQESDAVYITERNSSKVCAFELPGLKWNSALSFTTAATGGDSEPNLTLLNLPDGQRRIYVSYDDHVYFHDAETGASIGEFIPSEGLETMYGDEFYQVIYIPDEGGRSGVYVYDQDGNAAGPKFGDRSIFDADAEGIWVYKCLSNSGSDHGEGLIVVADQKEDLTDFEVFNRRTREYLGKLNISGVNNTDGLSILQQASSAYPLGVLAVIDDDTSTVGVGWDTILAKTGLSCGS